MRLHPLIANAICCVVAIPVWAQSGRPREAYADLSGVRLFFADSGGRDRPVVFLHAATGSVPMWENQLKAITSAGYRFIAYDRRGHGKSVANSTGLQPGVAADDLLALLDYLRIDRADLVAAAAGGSVAIDFALACPDRIRSLVIACSLGGIVDDEYRKFGEWLRPAAFYALPPEMMELGPEYRAANREKGHRTVAATRWRRQAAGRWVRWSEDEKQTDHEGIRSDRCTDSRHCRRRRFVLASKCHAAVRQAYQGSTVHHNPGCGPLRLLGTSGTLQPCAAGVSAPSEVVQSNDTSPKTPQGLGMVWPLC